MVDIKTIPGDELISDLEESITDIEVCTKALALSITHHANGVSVQYRIDVNRNIVKKITAELQRRGLRVPEHCKAN